MKKRLSPLLFQHVARLLTRPHHTTLLAVMLSLMPYTTGVAMALIALVTLRNGPREGMMVLLPVLLIHGIMSSVSYPMGLACVNTLMTFLPVFVAAGVLGRWASWHAVCGVFFVQAWGCMMFMHWFHPELIQAQYVTLKTSMTAAMGALPGILNDPDGLRETVLSNYVLGIQSLCVVVYALFALMLARWVQSRLFYPGGFRQELLTFRASKLTLCLGLVLVLATFDHQVVAINVLPLLIFYFFLAGLSFMGHALQHTRGALFLLFVPLMCFPVVMLPVYVMIGSIDGLFNLRTYVIRVKR